MKFFINTKGMRFDKRIPIFFNDIKFGFQRFFRGYDDSAVYSLDTWFIEIIPDILNSFQDSTISHPCALTYEEWLDILKEMEELIRGMDPFAEDLTDIARQTQIIKNKERFFELFSQYFYDLWD